MCGRVTRCSITSFVTAGLRSRFGYRGGRVSPLLSFRQRPHTTLIRPCLNLQAMLS